MSKVKVTKKQANVIDNFKDGFDNIMRGLTYDDFIKAVKEGYEVEPEWKYGDWFVYIGKDGEIADYIKKGFIEQVEHVSYGYITDGFHRFYNTEIRHATPSEIAEEKECRWWGSNNRNVWELEEGDLLKNLHNKHVYEILNIDELSVSLDDGLDYRNKDEIKDGFIVACFYQNRLDVKTNE